MLKISRCLKQGKMLINDIQSCLLSEFSCQNGDGFARINFSFKRGGSFEVNDVYSYR